MDHPDFFATRRDFIQLAAAAGMLPLAGNALAAPLAAAAKFRRYNVASPEGQRMLASYARGVAAMLKLPPEHPQNWFRNAFVHLLDCPHGNWWFYVWHRGYIGYFEQSIRTLSGDPLFTLPYWDWTELPQIPDGMFDGALNPADAAYLPTTRNLAVFTAAMRPALEAFWATLTPAQAAQLALRGYPTIDKMWNDVTGCVPAVDPADNYAIAGNIAFAPTGSARYLTRDNPKFDAKTAKTVASGVISAGLLPTDFYNDDTKLSFTSMRTTSHNAAPNGNTRFSMLEGMPHNKVHNYIGGVGPLDYGPYGNMTNFLSPVDPIFFLHHANMDRLWDVWERKQKRIGLPYLPTGDVLKALWDEPFLFFVKGDGFDVGPAAAGQFLSTAAFDYDYQPGTGEDPTAMATKQGTVERYTATPAGEAWVAAVPESAVRKHLAAAAARPLVAEVTITRPGHAREFDVLINAPESVTRVEADSPYYAGTVAFFGPAMSHAGHDGMASQATFIVPLPRKPALFMLNAEKAAPISIRVVPSAAGGASSELHSVTISRQ